MLCVLCYQIRRCLESSEGQWDLSVEVLGVVLDVVAHEGVDEEVTVVIALVRKSKTHYRGYSRTLMFSKLGALFHTHVVCVSSQNLDHCCQSSFLN